MGFAAAVTPTGLFYGNSPVDLWTGCWGQAPDARGHGAVGSQRVNPISKATPGAPGPAHLPEGCGSGILVPGLVCRAASSGASMHTHTLPSPHTLLHTCALTPCHPCTRYYTRVHTHPPYHPYTRYYTHTPPHHSGTPYHTHTQTHSHSENSTYFTLPRGAGCQVKKEPSLMWVSSSLQGIELIKVKGLNCQSFRK